MEVARESYQDDRGEIGASEQAELVEAKPTSFYQHAIPTEKARERERDDIQPDHEIKLVSRPVVDPRAIPKRLLEVRAHLFSGARVSDP